VLKTEIFVTRPQCVNLDEMTQNKDLTKEKREFVTARMDRTHAKRFMQQDSRRQLHI
jgi:hypothetical protein